jgi:hypothetical protein
MALGLDVPTWNFVYLVTKAYLGYQKFASTALDNTMVFTFKLVVTAVIPEGRGSTWLSLMMHGSG